ncbi:MAG: hypothetical protein KIG51_00420, partial [Fibrobacter sp.]|nr:hypothetical protein [Fibrobacter sp.]
MLFFVWLLACAGVAVAADAKSVTADTAKVEKVQNRGEDPRTEEDEEDLEDAEDSAGVELEEPVKIAERGKTGVARIDSLQTYE